MGSGWHKSSRCESGACVEVRTTVESILVRDSKRMCGAILKFPPAAWNDFLAGIREGEFVSRQGGGRGVR